MSNYINTVGRVDLKLTFLVNGVLQMNLNIKNVKKLGHMNDKVNPDPKSIGTKKQPSHI